MLLTSHPDCGNIIAKLGEITMVALAPVSTSAIARPLKILIPLIQGELQQGNSAGREHYHRAGEMLIEAKEQVSHGHWGTWLSKNFDLHVSTARVYMRWARGQNERGPLDLEKPSSLSEMRGDAQRRSEQAKKQAEFKRVLRNIARDKFVQERQSQDEEIKAHRALALKLIQAGYLVLSRELHPDKKGGSKEGMTRLNRVRDELKSVAHTRRFI